MNKELPRILYVVTRAEIGGAQMHVLDLIRGFQKEFEIHLAVGDEGYLVHEVRNLGIPVHLIPHLSNSLRIEKDALAILQTIQLIKSVQPDLIHSHSTKAGLVGRLAGRMQGKATVFTAHGWAFTDGVPTIRRTLALFMERMASHASSKIIAVSAVDRDLARSFRVAPADRIAVIHNGVRDVSIRANPGIEGVPTIVMVARFSPPKDQELLIRSLAQIQLPFRLIFVGDGPEHVRVRRLTTELDLLNNVDFVGNRNDVERILGDSHIFVLTSNWEGFPLAILEAMRAGLPVIASDVGGCSEAVIDGVTGYLVKRGDEVQLRERLQRLIEDSRLRCDLGQNGRQLYEERFTLDRMLESTREVYNEVLSQQS